jgi:hypothetical protein
MPLPQASSLQCEPYDPDESQLIGAIDGLLVGKDDNGDWVDGNHHCLCDYKDGNGAVDCHDPILSCPSDTDLIVFLVLVRTLLCTVLALTATLGATRVLGQILGTEIDVSGLARLS